MSESECPVCGQEYDHKREDSRGNEILRADATECKSQTSIGSTIPKTYNVYVHLNGGADTEPQTDGSVEGNR